MRVFVCLLGISIWVFAQNAYAKFYLDNDQYIAHILRIHKTNPEMFKGIDRRDTVLYPVDHSRLDLMMSDLIDQVQIILEKNEDNVALAKIQAILSDKPLENFPSFYNQLEVLAKKHPDLKKLFVQVYEKSGAAKQIKLRLHKKGRHQRLVRLRLTARYNQIAWLPEGPNLLRYLSSYRSDRFLSKRLTLVKFKKWKKKEVKSLIKKYNKLYFNKLIKLEDQHIRSNNYPFLFRYIRKVKRPNPFQIEALDHIPMKKVKNTKILFRTIQKLSNKIAFLSYLHEQKPELKLPILEFSSQVRTLAITPSVVHAYKDDVFEVLRDFTLQDKLTAQDDMVLNAARNWVAKNRELFHRDTGFNFVKKRPTRSEIIKWIPVLLEKYPEQPWMRDDIFANHKGALKLYTQKGGLRTIFGTHQWLKRNLNWQTLVSSAGSMGVIALTQNPYLGVMSFSLMYDSLNAARYNKHWWTEVKTKSPKRILTGSIFASGFVGGEIAHAIVLGGITGGIQSFVTGRPIDLGAIVGGVTEGLIAVLPAKWTNFTVEGMNKNLINGLIEVATNTFKGSVKGFMIAALDDGDGLQGLKEGAIYGAGEAVVRIIILGFRYDPTAMISEEQLIEYAETEHNPVVADRAYDGEYLYVTKEDLNELVFRKDSLARSMGLIHPRRSFEFGGMTSITPRSEMNVDTLIHEAFHYGQEKKFGFLDLVTRYIRSVVKFGNSIYEDYVFCTCPGLTH